MAALFRRRSLRRVLIMGGSLIVLAAAGTWWYLNPFRQRATTRPAAMIESELAQAGPVPQKTLDTPVRPSPAAPLRPVAEERLLASPKPEVPTSAPANAPTSAPTSQDASHSPPHPGLVPLSQPAAPASAPAASPASQPAGAASPPTTPVVPQPANPRLASAQQKINGGKLLEARQELDTFLRDSGHGKLDDESARCMLAKLADEMIFSKRVVAGDPAVDSYTIKAGDRLINIARNYDVPHDILLDINKIASAGTIRADQKIKVLKGPFNVRITKSAFRLDLYLGDLYVRSYPVGLGVDGGTPTGVWKVKDRLSNPTYYPSASATDKRIVAPDDPNNPLGEHWIGLEGVEGEAVGHDGYGIHGTIDDSSIGKAMSLGCVRMHNQDVAFIFKCLMPGKSKVTVMP
jgi:lipoprotein-anchoring transpeptidase ErfK/SrfK